MCFGYCVTTSITRAPARPNPYNVGTPRRGAGCSSLCGMNVDLWIPLFGFYTCLGKGVDNFIRIIAFADFFAVREIIHTAIFHFFNVSF